MSEFDSFSDKIFHSKLQKILSQSKILNTILPKKTPSINIAVVGQREIGKTKLICDWLSLSVGTIIVSNVFSKIMWIGEDSVQVNIHEFSSHNSIKLPNEMFHAILYVYDIDNDNSKEIIPGWIEFMKNKKNDLSYQVILGLSKKTNLELNLEFEEIKKEINNIRKFYEEDKIMYHRYSSIWSKQLSDLLETIILEAYDIIRNIYMESTNNNEDTNSIEMNIFESVEQPLLNRTIYDPAKNTSCCVLI